MFSVSFALALIVALLVGLAVSAYDAASQKLTLVLDSFGPEPIEEEEEEEGKNGFVTFAAVLPKSVPVGPQAFEVGDDDDEDDDPDEDDEEEGDNYE